MKKPKDTTPMITKSRLKSERGWTDKLLKMFLPNPELEKPNPNYRSGPPMQLFSLERIEAIEQTEEYKTQRGITAKRKEAAERAVETKWEKTQQYLDAIEIKIPILDRAKLVERACRHYNNMQDWRAAEGRYTPDLRATPDSDAKFLERICVNYLRHCHTKYEDHLAEMSGKVGVDGGYEEVRHKVFAEIAVKYEWLAEECRRQQENL
jgi:hypothetical protein